LLVGQCSTSSSQKKNSISNTEFIRTMSRALFAWRGNSLENTKCYFIHGINDKVVYSPQKRFTPLHGGHFIVSSHPLEVASFIEDKIFFN
jgi:hypothetical protein